MNPIQAEETYGDSKLGDLDLILQAFLSLKILEEVKKSSGSSFDQFLARLSRNIGKEIYALHYHDFISLYSDRVIYEHTQVGESRRALRAENLYLGLLEAEVLSGTVLPEEVIAALPATPECAAIRQLQMENQARQRILSEFAVHSAGDSFQEELVKIEVHLSPMLASKSEAVHVELERLMVEVNICRYDKNGLLQSISDIDWVYVGEVALAFLDGKPVASEIVDSLPVTAAGGETIRRLIQASQGVTAAFSL